MSAVIAEHGPAVRCRSCGELAETWADCDVPIGGRAAPPAVIRLWLCFDCIDHGRIPRLSCSQAVGLVLEHPGYNPDLVDA